MLKKILLVTILLSITSNAQQVFEQRFNPIKGKVYDVEKEYRDEICLNGRWQFMPVYKNSIDNFVKPKNFVWDKTPIKIPSPWNVNGFPQGVPTDMDNGNNQREGGDFLAYPSYPKDWEDASIGWMKKEFEIPKSWNAKRKVLHFEAIAGYAKIYVNGKLVKENLDIFLPTIVDVTDFLKKGTNELLVGVARASLTNDPGKYGRRKYVAGSFWGKKIAGIWHDVYLYAVNEISIDDVFVQPFVSKNLLNFEIALHNYSSDTVKVSVDGVVKKWVNEAGEGINAAPVQKYSLGEIALKIQNNVQYVVAPNSKTKISVSTKVNDRLDYWTPESPNLYAAILSVKDSDQNIVDKKYERFGWREFSITGKKLLLNGNPITLKGDSWHFMGIPQMTRRYAWGWYKMLKDANANAVRLHAQPFPKFYLDVADEMGICVLDETAIWSSDGGPKYDSDEYWDYCRNHVKQLVLRDRNHPSVFGWSVCNETLPVAIHVFHAPEEIVQRQIDEINEWVKIVRDHDSTRDWISGDGETMRPTDLPTIIGHYGGRNAMENWSSQNMPWGIGEQGMGYFGTPNQVSVYNGDRAFESMLGRMEGVALEAYDLLKTQLEFNASYSSIFNVIWYGLKPLEFGLSDLTRKSTPKDGIHFTYYKEGIPGVQPERLGPYCSTINPGYDPDLPLYKPWPLFDAVKAAFSEPMQQFSIPFPQKEEVALSEKKLKKVFLLSNDPETFFKNFDKTGIAHENFEPPYSESFVLIDPNRIIEPERYKKIVEESLEENSIVFISGLNSDNIENIKKILPYSLELTDRNSTSFIVKNGDVIISALGSKNFYFSETVDNSVMDNGLKGELVNNGRIVLEACNTDWTVWNKRPEFLKTASIIRSEREKKSEGAALVKLNHMNGIIYLSTIDFNSLGLDGQKLLSRIFYNLGVELGNVYLTKEKAFDKNFNLFQALTCGFFPLVGNNMEKASQQLLINEKTIKPSLSDFSREYQWTINEANKELVFDFKDFGITQNLEKGIGYLSFWIYSPRSLVNLLAEPDMPTVNMLIGADDGFVLYLNGGQLFSDLKPGGLIKDEYIVEKLPLSNGWNHILIKSMNTGGDWEFSARLDSNDKTFLMELDSALEK